MNFEEWWNSVTKDIAYLDNEYSLLDRETVKTLAKLAWKAALCNNRLGSWDHSGVFCACCGTLKYTSEDI
jgi:hypothetical protein